MDDPLSHLPVEPGTNHEPNRMIFRYFDGTKTRMGDPIEMQLRFLETGFTDEELQELGRQFQNPTTINPALVRRGVEAIRSVFKVQELTEDENGKAVGLSIAEIFELFGEFIKYTEELKKTEELNQTLQQPRKYHPCKLHCRWRCHSWSI